MDIRLATYALEFDHTHAQKPQNVHPQHLFTQWKQNQIQKTEKKQKTMYTV